MAGKRISDPDLLVSPDRRHARSVAGLTAAELERYRRKGWARVPFDEHVGDVAPLILEAALTQLAREQAGRQ